jgi:hypothetical protein
MSHKKPVDIDRSEAFCKRDVIAFSQALFAKKITPCSEKASLIALSSVSFRAVRSTPSISAHTPSSIFISRPDVISSGQFFIITAV